MAITASFAAPELKIDGDGANNSITVGRTSGGTLRVNSGAVPISGGTATTGNTNLINIIAAAGADTVTIDETNGPMPAVSIDGGTGNDTLTGGSSGDELVGGADNDVLFGRGGTDTLFGGIGNDTLVGGDGDDQLFGEDGDDHFVWNPGDDTDLVEGGIGTDTVEVNGGNGAEVFSITANGTRVRFDRVSPAPFSLDIGTSESLMLNAGGGDDSISATGNLAALIGISINGGAGNDTILGGNGADLLIGGRNADLIDGNQGNDTILGSKGNDTVNWDPGDGSDVIEGQSGTDTLQFNGSAANETYELGANGDRTRLTRDVGAITMDIDGVEIVQINALGGTDAITIGDLTGTAVRTIFIGLGNPLGGEAPDGSPDSIVVLGSEAGDRFTFNTGTTLVSGAINILAPEISDTLSFDGGEGADRIDASTAQGIRTTILGGEGNDTLLSGGDGTLLGGAGNDTIIAGLTNSTESLDGGADIDTLDTTSWDGLYIINLVTGATNYSGELFSNFENIITGEGADEISGTDAANSMRSNGGADYLYGFAGADRLDGGSDNDSLEGGSGADTLIGGQGADSLVGGTGDDLYVVDADDTIVESSGYDTARSSVKITAADGLDALELTGSKNIAGTGNALDNHITGNGGANKLKGMDGDDVLAGRRGNDTLNGGDGRDTFVFDTTPKSGNIDVIKNYSKADDIIALDRNEGFEGLAHGKLLKAAFFASTSGQAHDANDRILYETDTGKLFYDKDGTGNANAVQFAVLSGHPVIDHHEFTIV